MSTATYDRPLRAVFTPTDAAEAAASLAEQKRRWGAFLTARDVVLGVWHGATDRLSRLVERLGLSGVLSMARRSAGWLLGGLGRARTAMRTPGVRPGLLWALTTAQGQQIAGKVVRPVIAAAREAAAFGTCTLLRGLQLLGRPGRYLAGRLEHLLTATGKKSARVRQHLDTLRVVLSPSGLVMQAVNGWARARTLGALVQRFLPRPWNVVGRLLTTWLAVPSTLRAQAYGLMTDPDDDPTPPAAVVRLEDVREDRPETAAAVNGVEVPSPNSVQKYPAKRSSHASKKRR